MSSPTEFDAIEPASADAVGRIVEVLRDLHRHMTWQELGLELGSHPENLRRWSLNGRVPLERLPRMAELAGVSLLWLVSGVGPKPEAQVRDWILSQASLLDLLLALWHAPRPPARDPEAHSGSRAVSSDSRSLAMQLVELSNGLDRTQSDAPKASAVFQRRCRPPR
jgi:hypothetical protein